jgi:hypothetical protein
MRSPFVQDAMELIRGANIRNDTSGMNPIALARMDAGESAFLERQLESVEARIYEKKFRELKYRAFIPVSNRDGAGAQTITYYLYTKIGMAKVIANPSDDLPRSDVLRLALNAIRARDRYELRILDAGPTPSDVRASAARNVQGRRVTPRHPREGKFDRMDGRREHRHRRPCSVTRTSRTIRRPTTPPRPRGCGRTRRPTRS